MELHTHSLPKCCGELLELGLLLAEPCDSHDLLRGASSSCLSPLKHLAVARVAGGADCETRPHDDGMPPRLEIVSTRSNNRFRSKETWETPTAHRLGAPSLPRTILLLRPPLRETCQASLTRPLNLGLRPRASGRSAESLGKLCPQAPKTSMASEGLCSSRRMVGRMLSNNAETGLGHRTDLHPNPEMRWMVGLLAPMGGQPPSCFANVWREPPLTEPIDDCLRERAASAIPRHSKRNNRECQTQIPAKHYELLDGASRFEGCP